jgi:hypothetical protein
VLPLFSGLKMSLGTEVVHSSGSTRLHGVTLQETNFQARGAIEFEPPVIEVGRMAPQVKLRDPAAYGCLDVCEWIPAIKKLNSVALVLKRIIPTERSQRRRLS